MTKFKITTKDVGREIYHYLYGRGVITEVIKKVDKDHNNVKIDYDNKYYSSTAMEPVILDNKDIKETGKEFYGPKLGRSVDWSPWNLTPINKFYEGQTVYNPVYGIGTVKKLINPINGRLEVYYDLLGHNIYYSQDGKILNNEPTSNLFEPVK